MKANLLILALLGISGILSIRLKDTGKPIGKDFSFINNKPHNKNNPHFKEEGKRTGDGPHLCTGQNAADIIALQNLYIYTLISFVNKGKESPADYANYLNAIAGFFSNSFSDLEITSIDGITVSCPNKTCAIHTFEIFFTNYDVIYANDITTPWVGPGGRGECYLTSRSLETARYILPGGGPTILLYTITINEWTYVPCNGNHCTWPWLITEWYAADIYFQPLPTPLYTNDTVARSWPYPSG